MLLALLVLVLVLFVVPIVLIRAYASSQKHSNSNKKKQQQDSEDEENGLYRRPFVLVHAHADDEGMFFLPTLLCLRERMAPAAYAQSLLVCLTSNPHQRAREYEACATRVLGLAPSQVRVVHCCPPNNNNNQQPCAWCDSADTAPTASTTTTVLPRGTLCDGFEHRYAPETVVQVLEQVLGRGMDWQQHTFLTFDEGGVSGHPNHIDVGRGVRRACAEHGAAAVYTLDTLPLLVKYVPVLFVLRFAWVLRNNKNKNSSSKAVCTCSAEASRLLLRALATAYGSQLVWYRCCFAVLSGYAYCNTLRPRGTAP